MHNFHILLLCFIGNFFLTITAYGFSGSTHPKDMENALKTRFIPHKAIYDLALKKVDKGSQLLNIDGQMYFELESSCEGWITNHSFTIFYEYQSTPRLKMTNHISTYESYDGQEFEFVSTREKNGTPFEEIHGFLKTDDNIKRAQYQKPENTSYPLGVGTLLPMQHTYKVLNAANLGKKFLTLPLFDGSNEKGPMDVSAFISPANGGKYHTRPTEQLYKIDLAFFQQNSNSEQAEYEITIYIHKSGIISYMLVNYGDFTIAQSLRSSEDLEETECEKL